MGNLTGVVERTWDNLNPNTGDTTYSFVVDGIKHGTYKTKPPVQQGDYITFDSKQNDKGYWNANTKTIRKLPGGAGVAVPVDKGEPAAPYAPAAPAAPATGGYGNRNADTQNSIMFQSARKDALETLSIAVAAGVLDLGAAAKKGKALDTLLTYADKLTQRYYEDTKTLGHKVAEAEEPAVEATPAPKKPKAAPVQQEAEEFEDDELGDVPF